MVRRKRVNPVGRLGVRYGRRVRLRIAAAESGLRVRHICQNCGYKAVKRVSVGIWKCRKCNLTFAGAAYSPTSEVGEAVKRIIRRNAESEDLNSWYE
ncbi:MAG: 50S ribosomal protein L37ae [Candidatus Bathyarchaeota archaeon]|nr:50S ribosomal protein L37ae [Candidatus Bathyarchaeota archaeon]